jgi:hypothetical protein
VRILEGISYCTHLKNDDKTGCSSCGGMSCCQPHNTILCNILLCFAEYFDKIVENHQCGCRHNRWTNMTYFTFVMYDKRNGGSLGWCIRH